MPLDTESAERERRIELAFAGLVSIALVALTAAVMRFSPANTTVDSPSALSGPIVVFPDFASISDTEVKKQQFFDFLQDYVRFENSRVTESRLQLLGYVDIVDGDGALSAPEKSWLLEMASLYEVEAQELSDKALVNELLERVDVIPASLVLAQAANESAWGTSRFALEGNNLFGQWCYEEGCGIIPNRRVEGAVHEVKAFDSIEDAIAGYFLNINTHHLYEDFRTERARLRQQGRRLDSIALVQGLESYSQRGERYIDEVQTLIQQNDLRQRDRRWLDN